MTTPWIAGPGPLGALAPLLGAWVAEGETATGVFRCERRFDQVLHRGYVQLVATWILPGRDYEELALFGVDAAGELRMWSFTSDGRQSLGSHTAAPDLPQPNITFEADMPSRARATGLLAGRLRSGAVRGRSAHRRELDALPRAPLRAVVVGGHQPRRGVDAPRELEQLRELVAVDRREPDEHGRIAVVVGSVKYASEPDCSRASRSSMSTLTTSVRPSSRRRQRNFLRTRKPGVP